MASSASFLLLFTLGVRFAVGIQLRHLGLNLLTSEQEFSTYKSENSPYANGSGVSLDHIGLPVPAYEVDAGQNFTLICYGSLHETSRLMISTSAFSDVTAVSGEDASECDFVDNTTDCVSLVIQNASDKNVGRYSCNYTLTDELFNPNDEEIQSIYIFVKDPKNFHVPQKGFLYFYQSILEFTDFTIGCKPTHPDVMVNLTDMITLALPFDPARITFDPKVGFLVKNTSSHTDNKIVKCNFTYPGHPGSQQKLWQLDVVPQKGINELPPNPILTISHKGTSEECHVRGTSQEISQNQDLILICSVEPNHDHKLQIEWYKDGKYLKPMHSDVITKKSSGEMLMYNRLSVKTVQKNSAGNYTCSVKNHGGLYSNSTVTIVVKDENVNECSLQKMSYKISEKSNTDVRGCVPVSISAGKIAEFTMRSGQHPLSWTLPDGTAMSSDNYTFVQTKTHSAGKFKFLHASYCTKTAVFSVDHTNIWDQGTYTFRCGNETELSHPDESNSVKFCLKIKEDPTTSIRVLNHPYSRFVVNTSYEFECSVTSNPLPDKIDWRFSKPDESEYQIKTFHWKDNTTMFRHVPGGRDFQTHSVLTWWTGEDTWVITCMSCIDSRCFKSKSIVVETLDYFPPISKKLGLCKVISERGHCTEFEPASEFGGQITLYETQEIQSIVFVSSVEDGESQKNFQNFSRSALTISGEERVIRTNHSFQILWNSSNLSVNDSGTFIFEDQSIEIEVKKILAPVALSANNMNGSEIYFEPNSSLILRLDCSVAGIPTPDVSWFKDGQHINLSSKLIKQNENWNVLEVYEDGRYSCIASNLAGSSTFFVDVIDLDAGLGSICNDKVVCGLVITTFGMVFIFIFLLLSVCYVYKKNERISEREVKYFLLGNPSLINESLPLEEQASLLPYDNEIEFPRDRLKLGTQIGSGAFGRVLKAEAIGIEKGKDTTTVAVKMINSPMDKSQLTALMAEIKIMHYIGKHLNVVNLLGACTGNLRSKYELLAIVEYCPYGNLQQFLIKNRHNFVNQVDLKSGLYDRNFPSNMLARSSLKKSIYKPSASVRYVKLSLAVGEEDEEEALLDVAHDESATGVTHEEEVKGASNGLTQKVSIISTDSDFDNVGTVTGGTEIYTNEDADPAGIPKRQHKISIMSTDSQFENIVNNTDMTELYNQDFETHERKMFCTKDLLSWGYQIAKGMEYLSSKRVVHGDLAARNILLAEDNVVKICDFGLAKNIYSQTYYRKKTGVPLPIKWMALEALTDQIFSTQTDVWSYGIVLWEMFSLGKTPYPGEPNDNFQVKIASGLRMSKPYYSPEDIYRVMTDCWSADPKLRPSFSELADKLGETLLDGDREHYFQLSLPYEVQNEEHQQKYIYLRNEHSGTNSVTTHERNISLIPESTNDTVQPSSVEMTSFSTARETSNEIGPTTSRRPKFQTASFFNPSYGQSTADRSCRRISTGSCNKVPGSKVEFQKILKNQVLAISEVDLRNVNQATISVPHREDQVGHDGSSTAEHPNSSASSRSSGFHSAMDDCCHPGCQMNGKIEKPRSHFDRLQPGYRKRALQSSTELRLSCHGHDSNFAESHITPPPSYENAVRDKRRFSFTNIYHTRHNP